MKRVLTCVFAFTVVALLASMLPQAAAAEDAPADRVVVMYFHRVPGCPTCQKMRGYTQEAVKGEFAKQIKDGKVELHYINFEDQKNAALTQGYKVSGPTLIVARVAGNKVAEYKNLTEIWSKVVDKPAFVKYVQENVKGYQK
jgi:thiol-disulfide isomerase/thioredoxin